jgi:hypothetical protein
MGRFQTPAHFAQQARARETQVPTTHGHALRLGRPKIERGEWARCGMRELLGAFYRTGRRGGSRSREINGALKKPVNP